MLRTCAHCGDDTNVQRVKKLFICQWCGAKNVITDDGETVVIGFKEEVEEEIATEYREQYPPSPAIVTKPIFRPIVGGLLFWGCGLYMWFVETVWFYRWWNLGGVVASLMVPPLAIAFPLVFWLKMNFLPTAYFLAWLIGLIGAIIMHTGNQEHYT